MYKYYIKRGERGKRNFSPLISKKIAEDVMEFHKGLGDYKETPLSYCEELSKELHLHEVMVKNESLRFNLNAFKVLGGSYAIGQIMAENLGVDLRGKDEKELTSLWEKSEKDPFVFITATDGNHGRGVAYTARLLGQKSVVYMPKGSSKERLKNIIDLGAEGEITPLNYDEAVSLADKHGKENNWILTQDTAWSGYEKIPTWIMQGYLTMGLEVIHQLEKGDKEPPTHIILQGGVGSYASAMVGLFSSYYKENMPKFLLVEPTNAACLYKSAKANDGNIHSVTGDMETIMAGLACGVPSTISWEILKEYGDAFLVCDDVVAKKGMQILGKPMGQDPRIISGESGGVGAGVLWDLYKKEELKELAKALNFTEKSRVLLFNTEGNTDKESYRKIMEEVILF